MNPETQGGEERSLEVHAEDAGPAVAGRHLGEGGSELALGRGDLIVLRSRQSLCQFCQFVIVRREQRLNGMIRGVV